MSASHRFTKSLRERAGGGSTYGEQEVRHVAVHVHGRAACQFKLSTLLRVVCAAGLTCTPAHPSMRICLFILLCSHFSS